VGEDSPHVGMVREEHIRKIILGGGCCLAFGAAFTNVGVVLETGVSVSHLTGDISRLSMDLSHWSPEARAGAGRVAAAAAAFFLGAFVSGYLIHHPSLDLARPYGRAITGIGLLFLVSGLLMPHVPVAGIAAAAFGCGLQNSLSTNYKGIILRTTHLTGLVTDCGGALGMRARGYPVPPRLYLVPGLLGFCFLAGGVCSGLMFFRLPLDVVTFAGCAYVTAGIAWSVAKRIWLRDEGKADC
jgi:uncharacterized membrane protein YoaK (UPF0700 family)